MANGMRFDIGPPIHGWTPIKLTAPGVEMEFDASYTPNDSISDLVNATAAMLANVPEQVVSWNTEPHEYEFPFFTCGGRTRLEIREFPDSRRRRGVVPLAMIEEETHTLARALWRGLRRLQGSMTVEDFAAGWGHPFPEATVERIGDQLRSKPRPESRLTKR
jgi:hypothetical protein